MEKPLPGRRAEAECAYLMTNWDNANAEINRGLLDNPHGSYQLADRLRVIVDQELGEGLRERIRARTDPIPESLTSLVSQPEDVWAVMGTVRNRIAHGSDKQPSSTQLGALTRLAHTVAIGASLNLLGVPDTVLCAAIDQGRWPVI
jgi:hypothetical protein